MMVDHRRADRLGIGERRDAPRGLGGCERAGAHVVEEPEQLRAIHDYLLPHFFLRVIRTASIARSVASVTSIVSAPIVSVSPRSGIRRNRSINRPAIVS